MPALRPPRLVRAWCRGHAVAGRTPRAAATPCSWRSGRRDVRGVIARGEMHEPARRGSGAGQHRGRARSGHRAASGRPSPAEATAATSPSPTRRGPLFRSRLSRRLCRPTAARPSDYVWDVFDSAQAPHPAHRRRLHHPAERSGPVERDRRHGAGQPRRAQRRRSSATFLSTTPEAAGMPPAPQPRWRRQQRRTDPRDIAEAGVVGASHRW